MLPSQNQGCSPCHMTYRHRASILFLRILSQRNDVQSSTVIFLTLSIILFIFSGSNPTLEAAYIEKVETSEGVSK